MAVNLNFDEDSEVTEILNNDIRGRQPKLLNINPVSLNAKRSKSKSLDASGIEKSNIGVEKNTADKILQTSLSDTNSSSASDLKLCFSR